VLGTCSPKKADVERRVVGDEDRPGGELEEAGQHRGDRRRVAQHGGADAGELGDLGRNTPSGVDQRGQLTEHLTATDLDRSDLGDRVRARFAPVVSKSTTTKVTSLSGVPIASKLSCRGCCPASRE